MSHRTQFESIYRSAHYCLWLAGEAFILRIDEPAPGAVALLRSHYAMRHGGYIVTPCNPRSGLLPACANRQRLCDFYHRLHAEKIRFLPSINRDPGGTWPDESGALLLDCSAEYAYTLGQSLQQNAIVSVPNQGTPGLIFIG